MRIGFDVSPLVRPHPHGVVRITRGLVEALEARGKLEVVRLEPAAGASSARWRALTLPRAVRELGLDGIHSCVSAFAWRACCQRIQTIHELPWLHGVHENADWRHRAWTAFGPLFADAVVTATEFVARDLRRRVLPGAAKITVCPWGVDRSFSDEPAVGVIDEVVLARHRLPQAPIALCLGAVRAKKNLAALLHGLAELQRRRPTWIQVVVTGGETAQLRQDLGLVSRLGLARYVSTLEHVDERELPALLRCASIVPVLSRSEGFGLPVIEAQACGTPSLVPRDSAQAEVAGALGITVDPDDPASVADGLERALEQREILRPKLVERAREFTWERAAERIENLWLGLA